MLFTKFCEASSAGAGPAGGCDEMPPPPPAVPSEWVSGMTSLLDVAFAVQSANLRQALREELSDIVGRCTQAGLSDGEHPGVLAQLRPKPCRQPRLPRGCRDAVATTPPVSVPTASGDARHSWCFPEHEEEEEAGLSSAGPSEETATPRRTRNASSGGYFGQLLECATGDDAAHEPAAAPELGAPGRIWQHNYRKTFVAKLVGGHQDLTLIGTPKLGASGSGDLGKAQAPKPAKSGSGDLASGGAHDASNSRAGAEMAARGLRVVGEKASHELCATTASSKTKDSVASRTPPDGRELRSSVVNSMGLTETPRSPRTTLFMPLPDQASRTSTVPMDISQGPEASWPEVLRARARALVENEFFGYAVAVAILANAITMGVGADAAATNSRQASIDEEPVGLQIASSVFCICFSAELLLRLGVYGPSFFTMDGWPWNLFDLTVVSLHVGEEIVSLAAMGAEPRGFATSFMRILRILRIVRMIRMVRLLRLVRELRTLVQSIGGTLASLFWTLLLLLLLIYIVAICFTQLVADSARHDPDGVAPGTPAFRFFGSLDRSILVLFQSMTGGVNWRDVLDTLVDRTSPFVALPFCLYIAFTVLAMLNVITGVFVESAIASTRAENSVNLVHSLREVVERMQGEGSSTLSWDNFQHELQNPRMLAYFRSIDLDPSEAEGLFRILDPDETGTIDVEDFIMGCLRLHGAAKAIDLTTLMCEVRWLRRRWHEHAHFVEQEIMAMHTADSRAHWSPAPSVDPPPSPTRLLRAPTTPLL